MNKYHIHDINVIIQTGTALLDSTWLLDSDPFKIVKKKYNLEQITFLSYYQLICETWILKDTELNLFFYERKWKIKIWHSRSGAARQRGSAVAFSPHRDLEHYTNFNDVINLFFRAAVTYLVGYEKFPKC